MSGLSVSRARSWFAMFADDCSVDIPRLDIILDLQTLTVSHTSHLALPHNGSVLAEIVVDLEEIL